MQEMNFDKDKIWSKVFADDRFPKKKENILRRGKLKYYIISLCLLALSISLICVFDIDCQKNNGIAQQDKETDQNQKIKKVDNTTIQQMIPITSVDESTKSQVEIKERVHSLSSNQSIDVAYSSSSLEAYNSKKEVAVMNDNSIGFNSNSQYIIQTQNTIALPTQDIRPIAQMKDLDQLTSTNKPLDFPTKESNENTLTHTNSTIAYEDENQKTNYLQNISKETTANIFTPRNDDLINTAGSEEITTAQRDSIVTFPVSSLQFRLFDIDKKVQLSGIIQPPIYKTQRQFHIYLQGGLGRFSSTSKFEQNTMDSTSISYFNKPIKSFHSQFGVALLHKKISIKLGINLQVFEHNGFYENDAITYITDSINNRIQKYKIESDYKLYQYYSTLSALILVGYNVDLGYLTLCPQLGIQLPIIDYSRGSLIQNSQLVALDPNNLSIKSKWSAIYGLIISGPTYHRFTPYLELNGTTPVTYSSTAFNYNQIMKGLNLNFGVRVRM